MPASESQSIGMKPNEVTPISMRHRGVGHSDRFYKELDYERKVARRRARLLTAAEEAFSVVRRVQAEEKGAII